MKTPIEDRDLTQEPPHSPRVRFGGFVILARTIDKCRASIRGTLGEYHFDCPLDNQVFSFKGIKGEQFKTFVASAQTYEDVADWLMAIGTPRTPQEIKSWSDKAEAIKLRDVPTFQDPDHKQEVVESCRQLGLDFDRATLFEWLDADDRASFKDTAAFAHR